MKKICNSCPYREGDKRTMREQAERILDLKNENAALNQKLDECRAGENEAASVLALAKKQADELVRKAKVHYALECERLKTYRQKWEKYIEGRSAAGILAENIKRTDEVLKECQKMLEEMLYTDLGVDEEVAKGYIAERDRLDDEPRLDYAALNLQLKKPKSGDKITDREIDDMLKRLRGEEEIF